MASVRIVLLALLAAIAYGILHDQVTARVSVEYFTIGHPPVFGTDDPTLLALGWGVLATWWVGLPLGVALAVAARAGRRPALDARDLFPTVLRLLAAMAAASLAAGVLGYALAASGRIRLPGMFAERIPADRRIPFLADLWAHNAAYLVGIVGGIVVCVRTFRRRKEGGRP